MMGSMWWVDSVKMLSDKRSAVRPTDDPVVVRWRPSMTALFERKSSVASVDAEEGSFVGRFKMDRGSVTGRVAG